LKPDNIYLSAKAIDTPYQYWDHESYSLGLIDLETAVDFKSPDVATIGQPLLAGTPSHMTPSHIFKNNILISLFGPDIRRVFYMQDWFAILAMIYNVATGKMLFAKTAKLIPQILRMKKKALLFHKPLPKIFRRVSNGFWALAKEEFFTKLDAEKERFSVIHLALPRPVVQLFQEELGHEKSMLVASIEQYVMSHDLFEDIRSELIHMSLYEISQYRILWEKGILGSDMAVEDKKRLEDSLKILEEMKRYLESHERIHAMLSQTLTCDEIMVYLFNRVMLSMHRLTWTAKSPTRI
jgi:serine/threonine protein kinase